MPPPDESICILRGEIKNDKSIGTEKVWAVYDTAVTVTKRVEDALDQSPMASVALMRRNRVPSGALQNPDRVSEAWLALMAVDDFLAMVKQITTLKAEVRRLRKKCLR